MQRRGLRWLKWISLLITIATIVIAIVLIWFGGTETLSPKSNDATADKPQTAVEAPVIVERKDGRTLWQLRASEANQQLNGQMHLINPELHLYNEQGSQVVVKGKQAWFNPLARNVRFEKSVSIIYDEWTIDTETLMYISGRDQISIPNKFTLHGKSLNAHGKNMTFDRSSEQLHVSDGIWIEDRDAQWQGVSLQ
ncbi:MAG: LPS export ABC transporter periplasmic protein LptC [Mariprofundus sp.]|nr:LPS export ABC transporter periplasmic protein LptC [Mariprofundus sp.]